MVAAVAATWGGGLIWFADAASRAPPELRGDAADQTDAIVVLTGGSRRVATGLTLFRSGLADAMFVSGVHQTVEVRELLALAGLHAEDLDCCIVLGYDAADTKGNAAETAVWMTNQGYSSLRLVTANYHMPRSLLEFAMATPENRVVPHPVTPDTIDVSEWWRDRSAAALVVGEYNKYLVVLLRYWLSRLGM